MSPTVLTEVVCAGTNQYMELKPQMNALSESHPSLEVPDTAASELKHRAVIQSFNC